MKKKFSIFGDSISTYEGSNPDNYNVFYNSEMKMRTGIARETDTWWGRVIDFFDGKLLVNNSWSGSRVTKYPDAVSDFPSGISLTRINSLSANGVLPDIIIVYLGTNDWGFGVPLSKTNDITDRKLCFDESYNYMLYNIKKIYPKAKVYCCTLSKTYSKEHPDFIMPSAPYGITLEAYNDIIRKAALKNGCHVVDIYGCNNPYDTIDGTHPNADGMKTISNNIIKEMLKSGEWNVKYRLKALFDKE